MSEKKYVINNQELMKEWDWDKNAQINLNPNDLTLGSNKDKVWWKCCKGHSWQTTIHSRAKLHTSCPYCSGRYATEETCLSKTNPLLASEWDYSKNTQLTPLNVKSNSHKKVWWLCKRGHSWEAYISDRNRGNGCPYCSAEAHSSFPEQTIYYYVKQSCPDTLNRFKHNKKFEADIYIPSKRVAIEYDGSYYHNNNTNDFKKNEYFKNQKIDLIRVKEECSSSFQKGNIVIGVDKNPTLTDLEEMLKTLFQYLNENYNVEIPNNLNVKDSELDILNLFIGLKKEESVYSNATLSKEWDYSKNLNIDSSLISKYSNRKFWWICDKRHSWMASCNNRIKGKGCPICSNKVVLPGFNDLQTTNPELIKFWNYKKNDIYPNQIFSGSEKKVWWICSKGHDYYMSIMHMK